MDEINKMISVLGRFNPTLQNDVPAQAYKDYTELCQLFLPPVLVTKLTYFLYGLFLNLTGVMLTLGLGFRTPTKIEIVLYSVAVDRF